MRRALIADDDQDAAGLFAQVATECGYEVETVNDGEAALAVLQDFQPDIALLDINMPKADGLEVARFIRSQPWGGAVTIVAVTGMATVSNLREAGTSGLDHCLTKPVDLDVILEILDCHLQ